MPSSLKTSKFKQLYDQYRFLMLHIAHGILCNRALAEEAVQDALVKILVNIDDVQDVYSRETKAWAVLITRRTALNKLKYEQLRGHDATDDWEQATESESVESAVLRNLRVKEVLEELKSIDGKYSELLILRYYYGYTDSKLAAHFGITAETVRKRCERGKKMMLKKLTGKKGGAHE
jgi:RNA polymerase sigma-70 factor (ECF subfamily)